MSDDDDTANIERALFRKAITEKDNLAALGFAMITGLKYHQPRAVAEAIEKVTPKSSDPAPITHLPASPSPKDSPSTANSAMPIVPPESSKSAILGTTDDNQPLQIGDMERRNGLYILGKPRMGKSWLISNLILQDIQNFTGVFFLDPHGDAIADIVPRINLFLFPQTCIILDPENEQYSFGINLLSCHDISSPKARSDTFARAKGVFDKLWKSTFEEKPWLQLILQNSLYALIENQGYTIAELPLFFTDSAFRDFICRNIKYNTVVADYWLKTFTAKTKSDQDAQLEAAQTRAEIMLAHPYVRDIVGQTKTTIDFKKIMDCKQIVFVKLSANLPYESKKIIGTILISELKHAIERRQTRNQFCIYVDEFQTFASFEDFSTLITQAPKYGVATTIAHHERHGQLLDDPMILGATAVIANKVLFQLTGRDAADFAPELAEDPPTETRTEPELVICQDPVSDLLRRPHRNAEIRVFVNKYLRPLQERRSDAREDMEGERLIRMDYLDEAAVLGTEERTGTLYGQADFQYRLLEAREAALRQARRQTGIMYDLFDTAKNLRLTLRGLNSFCTDIMEGRQARGQESFSQFLIGLVHNFAGVEEKYRDALELYIALSYGDPKAPRSIPFAFAQKYGLFHTAAAEALRQAEIKRKGEEDKRHGDYIAHWEADTEHRESSRRFRVRDLVPKLQNYDLQFGKFFDLERDLLKPFLFISACPYAQQALAPFLSTRFAGLWKEAYKNWRPSIPRDVLKRLEYLRDDDGRDIYNAFYSTRDKVHFSVGFLDSFRAFFEKYEEGAVVALALVGTAEFPTRWVWDLGGKSGDTGYYPYFNVLYLPDIENRKPWEVLSLLEELTAALSGIKCETDCAKFYESANGANPYTRKKREMRGGYEIETDLDNLVGFGAHAGDLTKLIEDRDELKEIKKAIDLNVWREYLDIGKHKWWDKSSDLMKAYLIARACDIVHFGKEVADFTFPQPDVNGAGDKEVTEFVAALVGMVKQKEKYHEWPKYLPQRVVPGTLDPRVLNGEEAQLVREACMKELQVSDEQIQKVAGTIDEFAKFCGLLGKPENHIKVRSGQYIERLIPSRTVADMVNEMEGKLTKVSKYTAYAKVLIGKDMWKGKIKTRVLPEKNSGVTFRRNGGVIEPIEFNLLALIKRTCESMCQLTSEIEKEIEYRQNAWRQPKKQEPQKSYIAPKRPDKPPPTRY